MNIKLTFENYLSVSSFLYHDMYLQFDDGLDSCETNKMDYKDLVQNKSKLNSEYTDDGILLWLVENIWVNELQNCHIWDSLVFTI